MNNFNNTSSWCSGIVYNQGNNSYYYLVTAYFSLHELEKVEIYINSKNSKCTPSFESIHSHTYTQKYMHHT